MTEVADFFIFFIPRWHPVKVNTLINSHWRTASKLKKADRQIVASYAARRPKATGKRRVQLTIVLDKGQRAGDPDAYWKSLLDALVHCGLLIDDNRQHVELAGVAFGRNPERWGTFIGLEDVSA